MEKDSHKHSQASKSTYTLGLDIGTTSIGWALLDIEREKIVKLGVRKFEEPRVPKTGETLTSKRQEVRGQRRTIRRRSLRKKDLLRLLVSYEIISPEQKQASSSNANSPDNIFRYPLSPWQLRAEGLTRKLTPQEWAIVLFHIVGHRGYQSNAIEKNGLKAAQSSSEDDKAKETRQVLEGIAQMHNELVSLPALDDQVHTIGEMIYQKYALQGKKTRNSNGQYTLTVGRDDLQDELEILFEKQKKWENPFVQDTFKKEIVDILNRRRDFSQGPGGSSPYGGELIERMLGKCTLEPTEKRAAKESYTGFMFRLWQMLNNLSFLDGGQIIALSSEQKESIVNYALAKKEVKYKDIRKLLGIEKEYIFKGLQYHLSYRDVSSTIYETDKESYQKIKDDRTIIPRITAILDQDNSNSDKHRQEQLKDEFDFSEKLIKKLLASMPKPEDKVFIKQGSLYDVKQALKKSNIEYTNDDLDLIIQVLSLYREDEALRKLRELSDLSFTPNEELLIKLASISSKDFMHLGTVAMRKLIPHLQEGAFYSEACELENYNHALAKLNRENITNPTVFRAFTQTRKIIKAINQEFGEPKAVFLEVARDLSKNKREKDQYKKVMDQNEARRRIDDNHFLDEMGRFPVGREAQIWRFYKEQDGKCLYCGNSLGDLNQIFFTKGAPAVEIEHTLPYARSLDNRQTNKTASCTQCNREKKDQTPFEFFGSDENSQNWRTFEARCNCLRDQNKKKILLTTVWDEEKNAEARINDTRYISRLVQSWLENEYDHLVATAQKGQKRNLLTVKGQMTATLRKLWGLEHHKYRENTHNDQSEAKDKKVRENERNHALDAVVIAAGSLSQLNLITRSRKQQNTASGLRNRLKEQLSQPWEGFSDEVIAFLSDDPQQILGSNSKYEGDTLEPIFISRRPQRGVKGAAHKETIYGIRHIKEKEETSHKDGSVTVEEKEQTIYLKKKRLQDIKLADLEIMAGRFDFVGEETPLYKGLKQRLTEYNNDPKKAFEQPFKKPSKNPDNAPVVNSIKVREKVGGAVPVLKGVAANGDMIRIDIFKRQKGDKTSYFTIPIYTKHRVEEHLPLKAIAAGKDESEWENVHEEEFYCSLYTNDYIKVNKKDGSTTEGYYNTTDRATGAISLENDKTANSLRIYVKMNVLEFKKYHVDLLGRKFPMTLPEKRQSLRKPQQKG